MQIELHDYEKGLLALALLGLGDRQASIPNLRGQVVALAHKLGITAELKNYAEEWVRAGAINTDKEWVDESHAGERFGTDGM